MIIHHEALAISLAKEFEWHPLQINRHLLDWQYYIPTREALKEDLYRFSQRMGEVGLSYHAGTFDCNAFASLLYGWIIFQRWKEDVERPRYALGSMLCQKPSPHAFNFALVRDGEQPFWYYIEPQNGTMYPAKACPYSDIWLAAI